jgi:hypothetical protein
VRNRQALYPVQAGTWRPYRHETSSVGRMWCKLQTSQSLFPERSRRTGSKFPAIAALRIGLGRHVASIFGIQERLSISRRIGVSSASGIPPRIKAVLRARLSEFPRTGEPNHIGSGGRTLWLRQPVHAGSIATHLEWSLHIIIVVSCSGVNAHVRPLARVDIVEGERHTGGCSPETRPVIRLCL